MHGVSKNKMLHLENHVAQTTNKRLLAYKGDTAIQVADSTLSLLFTISTRDNRPLILLLQLFPTTATKIKGLIGKRAKFKKIQDITTIDSLNTQGCM